MSTDTQPEGRRSSAWTLWAWLMVAAAVVSIAAGVVGGMLSPSVLLDVVSLWPLLLLAFLIAAALLPLRKRGPARIAAALPLLIITMLGASVVLHLSRWDRLPSAAANLVGPSAAEVAEASLSIDLGGDLTLRAGSGDLYTVIPERRGGSIGVPEALESDFEEGPLFVLLRERDAGRWFRTAGWDLTLAADTLWTLAISSPNLQADLSRFSLRSVSLSGAGSITLPAPGGEGMQVTVDGEYLISVPSELRVEVTGAATVPGGWLPTEDGYRSPYDGPPIAIEVGPGATVEVRSP